MIKFKINNKETGKTESYEKKEITVGEAEKFYEHVEIVAKEEAKENPETRKMRKRERQLLVGFFSDQGLTEDNILNNMSTKTYNRVMEDLFREVRGENEENSEDASDEMGKTEVQ